MKVKFFILIFFLFLGCFGAQGQIIGSGRVLEAETESWVEEIRGVEVLHREKIKVSLYLDQDILRIGDDRYEIVADLGPYRDIRDNLIIRFEALDKHVRRVRLVFLTGSFVNQIQIIYANKTYKYNLEQHWLS